MSYLEILNGLHKGARFLAKDRRWKVGADDENSVVLLDDDLPGTLLVIVMTENGFAKIDYAESEVVLLGDSARLGQGEPLYNNTKFSVGPIEFRLCVPAERPIVNTIEMGSEDDAQDDASIGSTTQYNADEIAFSSMLESGTESNSSIEPAASIEQLIARFGGIKRIGIFAGFLTLALFAYIITGVGSRSDVNAKTKAPDIAITGLNKSSNQNSSLGFSALTDNSGSEAKASEAKDMEHQVGTMSIAQKRKKTLLRSAQESLESGLVSMRLDEKLSISVKENTVSVSGRLTRTDRKRFERVLHNVVEDFGTEVLFLAEIASYEDSVTLVVKQVVGGQNPMVVLDDGSRLFVGSVYKGSIVESITTEKVVLRGRELIEVTI